MSAGYHPGRSSRWSGGAVAAVITLAIGWGLVSGLATRYVPVLGEAMAAFDVLPKVEPVPELVIPPPEKNRRSEGRAAPPGLRAKATEIVAPEPPPLPLPPPPQPVVVAPIAGIGNAPRAGAADVPGPGPGAGGIGDGTGAGGDGDGDGGGWMDEQPPEQIRGRLSISDLPDEIAETGGGGRVGVRYEVRADGRVGACRVTRSSGSRQLDDLTCRLIQQRFRFRPALDGRGRPVDSTLVENHDWDFEIEPPAPRRRGRW